MKHTPALLLSAALAFTCTASLLKAEELDAEAAKNAVMFDGASRNQTEAKAANTPLISADKAQLAAEFKKQLKIDDRGNPAEKAALEAMILRMMDSPTAREAAAQFINAGVTAEISFEDFPGSAIATVDGRKTFFGTLGHTMSGKDPPEVLLNKLFMQYDRDKGASTLAHEMLGHVLGRKKAGGAMYGSYLYSMLNEENASIIGWLTASELGAEPNDEIWDYTQDPDNYIRSLTELSPVYAVNLTRDEMREPMSAYKRRLADTETHLAELKKQSGVYAKDAEYIDHFITAHKMDPAAFRTISDELKGALADLPEQQKLSMDIIQALREIIAYFSSESGKGFLSRFPKDADSPYFRQVAAGITERRAKLKKMLPVGTQIGSSAPPDPGQLTWEQLIGLEKKDSAGCPYGGVK
ncbi:MAG: hypothetical protein WC204_11330 [Elusimicrobiales bacterium]|jgi:hypothetical protein